MWPPLPPHKRLNARSAAGQGFSTVIADFDFETYSEAGFVWNGEGWDCLNRASVKGLGAIGAARYSEHPSTEVLSLAYNLKNGSGSRLWRPGMSLPQDLFDYIATGGLLEAWNCSFENWIWVNVCVPKYGWPILPRGQLRDAMAKARAFALPGSLAAAGDVLNVKVQKDKLGGWLLKRFSIPRDPTLKDNRTRIKPEEDSEHAQQLYSYNATDIESETEISALVPDLNAFELEFWQCDQDINFRGVQLDRELIEAAIKIVEAAEKKYNAELQQITNGQVKSVSEIAKLTKWVDWNVPISDLRAETVREFLKRDDLPTHVRRALQIRELIGSSAVKKLYAMRNQMTAMGRIHDLFIYHSARTGRAAGATVQPQNLPNSGLEVITCINCKRYSGKQTRACYWCGYAHSASSVPKEWNADAMEDAIETIATGNLELVEMFWGDAIEAVSGCLRGMFIAKPGYDLIGSDYSAIEAVVLAALAGEKWRLQVFETHGKIYEASASKISGVPFEEFERYKKETGQHHPLRKKIGKVAELACFTANTQVLTNRGYIHIKDVLLTDKLWDGLEWVNHEGVIAKGKQKIICVDGVKMTPNHPINLGDFWTEAKKLVLNENILYRALEIGSKNLPLEAFLEKKYRFRVHVQNKPFTKFIFQILEIKKLQDAINALKKNLKKQYLSIIGNIKTLFQKLYIDDDYLIDSVLQYNVVIIQKQNNLNTMEKEELPFLNYGEKKKKNFLNTLLHLKDGMTPVWKSIELTLMGITSQVISNLQRVQKIQKIREKFEIWKIKLCGLKNVYDIVNVGTRNRFTIKTNSGNLIVHNSGYQGWIGAWKNFGADEFFSDEEMKQKILAWRAASPNIVEMWGGQEKNYTQHYYGLEGMAIQAVLNPGQEFKFRGLITYKVHQDVLYCQLPSGRYLTYHKPRLDQAIPPRRGLQLSYEGWNTNPNKSGIGWIRMITYGGMLTENVVQAVARDRLAYAITLLEKNNYPVVLHVHDEAVSEIPQGWGSLEEFETIMNTPPVWAVDWPIKATGGWRGKRYRK